MSSVHGLHSSQVVLDGVERHGWWLVSEREGDPGRVVAGPFPDRAGADLVACGYADPAEVRPVFGFRRADGVLKRRPSPQDWAWLAHLAEQLQRLPDDWDATLPDDDPLVTLVVEVTAALAESGLPVHDGTGPDGEIGGVCLMPEPDLGGIVVAWRQHDRTSVDRVHGAESHGLVQDVMNRALADVLLLRGFSVEAFGGAGGSVVRAT